MWRWRIGGASFGPCMCGGDDCPRCFPGVLDRPDVDVCEVCGFDIKEDEPHEECELED